jgi:hypothetical protein
MELLIIQIDFAGCADSLKSPCYDFTHANGVMSWKSSKQIITASSMMHVEFLAY